MKNVHGRDLSNEGIIKPQSSDEDDLDPFETDIKMEIVDDFTEM